MKMKKIIDKIFKNIDNKNDVYIKKYSNKNFRYSLKLFVIIIIISFLFLSLLTKNKEKHEKIKFKYFSCFGTIVRQENIYIRDLISYYLSIGFDKFIIGDNI